MSKEEHICEFCNKSFTTKSNLKFHINNVKKCLEIQGKNNCTKCEFCNIEFSSVKKLNYHHKHDKKCMNLRGISKDIYTCNKCLKVYTSIKPFISHQMECMGEESPHENYFNDKITEFQIKYTKEIKKLETYIKQLEDQIEELKNDNTMLSSIIKIKKKYKIKD